MGACAMIIFLEEQGNLRIKQYPVEGWVEGVYNTHISYNDIVLAIKYHFHASDNERRKTSPAAAIYNLTNELEIMPQCNLYKKMLNDIHFLKMKIAAKIKNNITYSFDLNFVDNVFRDMVNVINNNIKNIYANLQFEAMAKGRAFSRPLPDYTYQDAEVLSKTESSTDISVRNHELDETVELVKQTKKNTEVIIQLVKEQRQENGVTDIINELVKALQLSPEPKEGKYLPANKNYKQFVYWLVDHDYDEYLNQDNFREFIYCDVKEENIKKYFREARDSKKS